MTPLTKAEAEFGIGDAPRARHAVLRAASDVLSGLNLYWLWSSLALNDVRRRYHGSGLGVLWITGSTLFMVVSIGLLFGRVLGSSASLYLPYFAVGWVVWQFISGVLTESPGLFLNQHIITQTPMPLSIHVFRLVLRNLLVFALNLPVVVGVALYFHVPFGAGTIFALGGVLLLAVNAVWVSAILGIAGARFRDVQPIMTLFQQFLFFLTPVLWSTKSLGRWGSYAWINPASLAIETIRQPFLQGSLEPLVWLATSAAAVAGLGLAGLVFARYRAQIPYWL